MNLIDQMAEQKVKSSQERVYLNHSRGTATVYSVTHYETDLGKKGLAIEMVIDQADGLDGHVPNNPGQKVSVIFSFDAKEKWQVQKRLAEGKKAIMAIFGDTDATLDSAALAKSSAENRTYTGADVFKEIFAAATGKDQAARGWQVKFGTKLVEFTRDGSKVSRAVPSLFPASTNEDSAAVAARRKSLEEKFGTGKK